VQNNGADPGRFGDRLDDIEAIDTVGNPVQNFVNGILPGGPLKDLLHGTWLGHPLHPLLTDLPIGFWTSAWLLDILGGKRSRPAADRLVALGVLAAVPTALSGAADWSELNTPERRSGLVHAVANSTATALYAWSYVARKRGRRGRGVALGMAGAAAATAGGYLGGHLTFRRGAGVNANALVEGPSEWTEAAKVDDLPVGQPAKVTVAGTDVLVVRDADGRVDAIGARCSHLAGPLEEGKVEGGCVTCPWHGSTFRLDDGSVVRGPATAPQPTFAVKIDDGRLLLRRDN
jgi:nitrite reductase/ring-hydroxylating ferredoxin subunit/uncharacterized membrane protein